jgi:hypothetical protein
MDGDYVGAPAVRRLYAVCSLPVTFLWRALLLRLTAFCLLIANQPSLLISFRRNGDLLIVGMYCL